MKVLNRIKKNVEFNEVIENGQVIKSDSITLYFQENKLGYARIGISIPKKSGKAVVRNKMKRQIRAIIAKDVDLSKSIDCILVARKAYDIEKFTKTESDIEYLFKKVG
jgi:ribonuclease P protein component